MFCRKYKMTLIHRVETVAAGDYEYQEYDVINRSVDSCGKLYFSEMYLPVLIFFLQ